VDRLLRGEKPSPVVLKGHEHEWIRLAFTADGERLVAGSFTQGLQFRRNPEPLHPLKMWDTRTGKALPDLPGGHASLIGSVTASPDGRWLASGGNHTIKVWDARARKEVRTIQATGDLSFVLALAFSADGRWLASTTQDRTVHVWEVESGREVFTLKGHSSHVYGLAFSADGKRLVSAGEVVKLWDLTTGQEVFTLAGHFKVALGADGRRLVSCGPGNTVCIWNAEPWDEERKAARRRALLEPVAGKR
jgi:WD40 repeat protein